MARRSNGEGSWTEKTVNGKKYITFRKMYNGVRKEFSGKTKKEVNIKREEFEKLYYSGGYVLKSKQDDSEITVSDCMEELIESEKEYAKESTRSTDRSVKRCYIDKYDIKDCKIAEINEEYLIKTMDMYKEKYSASVINKIYNLLNQTFKMAMKKNIIKANPLDGVKKPTEKNVKKKKKEIKFLTDEEMNRFHDECFRKNVSGFLINGKEGTYVYKTTYAFGLVLLMETGMRIGELLALKYEDIDIENKTINISKTLNEIIDKNGKFDKFELTDTPKTSSSKRKIPLTDKAEEIIEILYDPEKPKDEFLILTSNKKHPQRSSIKRTLKSMLIRADCPKDLTPHGLRHSFASRAIRHGISIEVLSKYLGHASISITTDVYVHILDEQKLLAIQKLNEI